MSIDSEPFRKVPVMALLLTTLLRIVAIGCLYFGLQYWAMLIGYSQDGTARFDQLSLPWRTAAASLAVLYPVAAVGLWLRASWGPVVWIGIAASEIAMHEIWANIFGENRMMTMMIGSCALLYLVLRFGTYRERRKMLQRR